MFKNKRWICIFIALFILISGMWIDQVKADSVFLCPKTESVGLIRELSGTCSQITKEPDSVISDVVIEPTQILCTRNTISSQQIAAQIVNSKRVIKLSMIFLCVAVFALLLSNFYAAERVTEYPTLCMRTVVLNYIHNTDGKK